MTDMSTPGAPSTPSTPAAQNSPGTRPTFGQTGPSASPSQAADAPTGPVVPGSPDGYTLDLPSDFEAPDDFTPLLESPTFAPLIDEARAFAHKMGFSQAQFSEMVAFGAKRDLVEHKALTEALGEQMKSLGSNGPARIDAVVRWITARLPEGQAKAMVNNRLFTKDMIEGFETIMRAFSAAGIPTPRGGGQVSEGGAMLEELGNLPAAGRFAAAMRMYKPKK